MEVRPLGSQGLMSSAQGYGAMGLSWAYGASEDDANNAPLAFEAIKAAGIQHIDTGWIYSTWGKLPHNEQLVGDALKKNGRSAFIVADKIGVDVRLQPPFLQSAEDLTRQLEESLSRLGTDYIDILYLNRPSPFLNIEDSMRVLKSFVDAGKVRYIGLIEVTAKDIIHAHAVHPISAVQLEWSVLSRDAEASIVPTCRQLGIGIVAYSPICRGMLGRPLGKDDVAALSAYDFRKHAPRFGDDNIDSNAAKVEAVAAVAARKGVTLAQISLAWLHAKGKDVFPIPGSRQPARIAENAAAATLALTAEDIADLDAIGDASGDRYHGMHGTWNSRQARETAVPTA